MEKRNLVMTLLGMVLIVLLSFSVIATSRESTQIPEGMTINEFKRAVERANRPSGLFGFLAISSGGTWRNCIPFLESSCDPCNSNEVESSCYFACIVDGYPMSLACCTSWSSCSSWSCCGSSDQTQKECYCAIPQPQCSGGADPGDKKCSGDDVWECNDDGVWEIYDDCDDNQEKCENAQCVSKCSSHAEKKCFSGDVYWYDSCGNKEEKAERCGDDDGCEDGECVSDPCAGVECSPKCQNSVRSYNGYCAPDIEDCVYDEEICDYGCDGEFCKDDLCAGVTCEDYCADSIFYDYGECDPTTGECDYSEQGCAQGCDGDECAIGDCEADSDCEDSCGEGDDKFTWYYDGECKNGECKNYEEKEYAYECGYEAWYQNTWIWVGGIGGIMAAAFGIVYYKRRFK